jgi:hypothetical protein
MENDGQVTSADMGPQVIVDEIKHRIETTQEELRAVEGALAQLPKRKETLLGSEVFDDTALIALEDQESALLRKRDFLTKRLPLLKQQHEQTEAKAAQERITELVT